MTKSNVTRKSALSAAIIAIDYLNFEGIYDLNIDDNYNDIKETLSKMLEQVSKPRAKAVSKARTLNESLAEWAYKNAPADVITTKELVELGSPEITTTQKAAAVLRVGCEMGYFEKVTDKKKVSYHKIAE